MFETIAQAYDTTSMTTGGYVISPVAVTIVSLIGLAITIATLAGMWKIFQKAGHPGWKSIVPIYNMVIFMRIIGRSPWLLLVFLLAPIPLIGAIILLIFGIITSHDLSKSFGKDVGMTVLLIFFPFVAYPMLGFGDATYQGPAALEGSAAPATPTPATQAPAAPTAPTAQVDASVEKPNDNNSTSSAS
ncbi:MAG TPA: DUF5684 domain-containing protein [Candidatus Saccharimonadales bacterium]